MHTIKLYLMLAMSYMSKYAYLWLIFSGIVIDLQKFSFQCSKVKANVEIRGTYKEHTVLYLVRVFNLKQWRPLRKSQSLDKNILKKEH